MSKLDIYWFLARETGHYCILRVLACRYVAIIQSWHREYLLALLNYIRLRIHLIDVVAICIHLLPPCMSIGQFLIVFLRICSNASTLHATSSILVRLPEFIAASCWWIFLLCRGLLQKTRLLGNARGQLTGLQRTFLMFYQVIPNFLLLLLHRAILLGYHLLFVHLADRRHWAVGFTLLRIDLVMLSPPGKFILMQSSPPLLTRSRNF